MKYKNKGKHWSVTVGLIIGITIILILTVVNVLHISSNNLLNNNINKWDLKTYEYQYVIVAGDTNETFWNSFYKGAKDFGEDHNAFIQLSHSNDFLSYTREDLLKMAIASKVDGIIVEGVDNDEISSLINKAVASKIPVISAVNDIYKSNRQSFVGVTNYDIGKEYGRQIIEASTKEINNILVLCNWDLENSSKNSIINGINETVKREGRNKQYVINRIQVDNEQTFGGEEQIRDIFVGRENIPDIIVCLDELNTINVYQAVVDFNVVDRTKIIGYNDSPFILKGISKEIIFSSIVLDGEKMGEECVKALNEYNTTGNVNDFVIVSLYVVNSKNVGEYLPNEETVQN